jgi:transcriptional regulator with XRE-family HTH domain
MTQAELLTKLETIRRERGWTQERMAQELGCSRGLYAGTKGLKNPLRHKLTSAIMRRFPELRGDVTLFLTGNTDDSVS